MPHLLTRSWLINNDQSLRTHLLTIYLLDRDDAPLIIDLAKWLNENMKFNSDTPLVGERHTPNILL